MANNKWQFCGAVAEAWVEGELWSDEVASEPTDATVEVATVEVDKGQERVPEATPDPVLAAWIQPVPVADAVPVGKVRCEPATCKGFTVTMLSSLHFFPWELFA